MTLAQRSFSDKDQQEFAAASGDHNPMHMDALLARRTQAGAPVVHGVHLLLWALDALAAAQPELPLLRKVRAQFNKFLCMDEAAEVVMNQQKPGGLRLDVTAKGVARTRVNVEFGDAVEARPEWLNFSLEPIDY